MGLDSLLQKDPPAPPPTPPWARKLTSSIPSPTLPSSSSRRPLASWTPTRTDSCPPPTSSIPSVETHIHSVKNHHRHHQSEILHWDQWRFIESRIWKPNIGTPTIQIQTFLFGKCSKTSLHAILETELLVVLSQEHCCTIRKSGQDILGTKHPKFLTHPVLAVRKAWMVRPPTLCAQKETSQAKAPSIAEFSFGIQHNLDII